MDKITKRVCVLTGASGLLGTAFIKRYANQYDIVAVYNNHPINHPALSLADTAPVSPIFVDPLDINKIEQPIYAMSVDLSHPAAITAFCCEVIDRFGRVDLLINNACALRNWRKLLVASPEIATDDIEHTFNINVFAPLRLSLGFADLFWKKQHQAENYAAKRNIVNISSTAGSYVYPDSGQTIYSASKAALNFASYHMASEFWEIGVRVNTISPNTFPGIIPTERVLDTIIGCDHSSDTGQLLLVDNK